MPQPPKRMPPLKAPLIAAPPANQQSVNKVSFAKLGDAKGQKILIYGTGGIGKSMLSCLAPGPVGYVDAAGRLSSLKSEMLELGIELPTLVPATNWKTLRGALQSSGWDGIKSIALDESGVIEEWCIAHCLETIKTFEKPQQKANSLEDYGFGKDVRIVYEAFLPLLADLDRHVREGRNIIITAHDCKPEEANPMGANFIRFEPRLRTSKKGDNSIRLKVKEWCDFVGFICYDVAAGKDERGKDNKKASGSGTRTMYLQETPAYMAKNHGCPNPIDLNLGESPWEQIIK
jgi:hypothetical protein